jgi:hypothetical protein
MPLRRSSITDTAATAGNISTGTMGTTGIIIVTKRPDLGNAAWWNALPKQQKRGIERGSKTIRAFCLRELFGAKARSRLQLAGNPVIVFGSKGYAGTRNQ